MQSIEGVGASRYDTHALEKYVNYASLDDLSKYGLPAQALSNFTADEQTAAIAGASAIADGYLRSRCTLPLRSWDRDLTRNVCMLAAYDLMVRIGFNPEGDDSHIRLRAEDALKWLKQVSEGVVTIRAEEFVSPSTLPRVHTGTKRGW